MADKTIDDLISAIGNPAQEKPDKSDKILEVQNQTLKKVTVIGNILGKSLTPESQRKEQENEANQWKKKLFGFLSGISEKLDFMKKPLKAAFFPVALILAAIVFLTSFFTEIARQLGKLKKALVFIKNLPKLIARTVGSWSRATARFFRTIGRAARNFFRPIGRMISRALGLGRYARRSGVVFELRKAANAFKNSRLIRGIRNIFGTISRVFQRVLGIGRAYRNVGFMGAIRRAASAFRNSRLIKGIRTMFRGIARVFRGIVRIVRGVVGAVRGVFRVIGRVFGAVGKVARTIMKFTGFARLARTAGGLGRILGKALWPVTIIFGIFDFIKGFRKKKNLEGEDASIFDKIGMGITEMMVGLIGLPMDLIKNAIAWILGKFGIGKTKDPVTGEEVDSLWMKKMKEFSFSDLIRKIYDSIWAGLGAVIDWIKLLFTNPVQAIKDLAVGAAGFLAGVGAWIYTTAFKPIVDWFGEKFAFVKAGLAGAWTTATAFIKGKWDDAIGWFKGLWAWASDGIAGTWTTVTTFVKGVWDKAIAWFEGLWTWASEGIAGTWTTVTTFVKDIWDGAIGWFKGLWAWASEGIAGTWTTVTTFVKDIWDNVIGWFTGLWAWAEAGIAGTWTGLVSFVKGIFGSVKEWFVGLFTWGSDDETAAEGTGDKKFSLLGIVSDAIDAIFGWFKGLFDINWGEMMDKLVPDWAPQWLKDKIKGKSPAEQKQIAQEAHAEAQGQLESTQLKIAELAGLLGATPDTSALKATAADDIQKIRDEIANEQYELDVNKDVKGGVYGFQYKREDRIVELQAKIDEREAKWESDVAQALKDSDAEKLKIQQEIESLQQQELAEQKMVAVATSTLTELAKTGGSIFTHDMLVERALKDVLRVRVVNWPGGGPGGAGGTAAGLMSGTGGSQAGSTVSAATGGPRPHAGGAVTQGKLKTSWSGKQEGEGALTSLTVGDEGLAKEDYKGRTGEKRDDSAQMAAAYAPQFQGFIQDLLATGYKIRYFGGYRRSSVAGTDKASWHQSGMAIDINKDSNPMYKYGSKEVGPDTPGAKPLGRDGRWIITDMPDNIYEIAQKWGLGWGGKWGNTIDAMHFSVAKAEGGSVRTKDVTRGMVPILAAAQGLMGFIKKPTLILAGEAGPEQVNIQPSSLTQQASGLMAAGNTNVMGSTTVNNVTVAPTSATNTSQTNISENVYGTVDPYTNAMGAYG